MTNSAAPSLVSGAIFIGVNVTDPHSQSTDVFKVRSNHITALSSIIAHSAETSGFSPYRHLQPQDPQQKAQFLTAYNAFIQGAISLRCFQETRFQETKSLPLDGSLDQFERAIREFLSSGQDEWGNEALIARNLRDLVPTHISKVSTTEPDGGQWILSLIVLRQESHSKDIADSKVYIQHAQVTLDIFGDNRDETQSMASIPEQSAKFEIGELELLAPVVIQEAVQLSEETPIVKLHSVIELLSSPKV